MSRNVLLILSDAAEAKVVRRSLVNSRDGPFKVEWVSRCCDAIERLGNQPGGGGNPSGGGGFFPTRRPGNRALSPPFAPSPPAPTPGLGPFAPRGCRGPSRRAD